MGIQSLFRMCETLSPGAFKPMPRAAVVAKVTGPRVTSGSRAPPQHHLLQYDHVYYDVNNVIYTLLARAANEEQFCVFSLLLLLRLFSSVALM